MSGECGQENRDNAMSFIPLTFIPLTSSQSIPRRFLNAARRSRNKLNSLSSIGWRRGPGRGGTFVFRPPLPHEPTQRFGTDKDGETTEITSLSAPNLWVFPLSGSGVQGANRASGNSLLGPLPTPASWGEEENTLRNFFATCERFRLWQCKEQEGLGISVSSAW